MASTKSFAVIGLGQFGRALVDELIENGMDVIAIDTSEEAINKISKKLPTAFVADSTNEQALKELGIQDVDAAIVAYGDNKEASILTTVILREFGVEQIIVRVDDDYYVPIMKKLGATDVITPQKAAGQALANRLGNEDYVCPYSPHLPALCSNPFPRSRTDPSISHRFSHVSSQHQ